jgi:hypothetical protein
MIEYSLEPMAFRAFAGLVARLTARAGRLGDAGLLGLRGMAVLGDYVVPIKTPPTRDQSLVTKPRRTRAARVFFVTKLVR